MYERGAGRLFEAVVDLKTQKLTSWVERPGVQPAVFLTEYADADAIIRADPRWRKAIRDRNLKPSDVYIDAWAPGSAALPPGTAGKRIMRGLSFFSGDLPNPYDRPIEGVVAIVDMNAMTVIDVTDTGIKPVNTTLSGSSDTTRPGLKPLNVVQPNGPSFKLKGNAVEWMGWQFRVGFNPREGLVLHEIGFDDGGGVRPIIQRMALERDLRAVRAPRRQLGVARRARLRRVQHRPIHRVARGGRRRADERRLHRRGRPTRHRLDGSIIRPDARDRPLRARRWFAVGSHDLR